MLKKKWLQRAFCFFLAVLVVIFSSTTVVAQQVSPTRTPVEVQEIIGKDCVAYVRTVEFTINHEECTVVLGIKEDGTSPFLLTRWNKQLALVLNPGPNPDEIQSNPWYSYIDTIRPWHENPNLLSDSLTVHNTIPNSQAGMEKSWRERGAEGRRMVEKARRQFEIILGRPIRLNPS
jgi:hypothetical protein